jgi:hypothetical protein
VWQCRSPEDIGHFLLSYTSARSIVCSGAPLINVHAGTLIRRSKCTLARLIMLVQRWARPFVPWEGSPSSWA